MNNKGQSVGGGLSLILLLIVAALVAWLLVQNMASMGMTKEEGEQQVDHAQEVVDQLNEKIQLTETLSADGQ